MTTTTTSTAPTAVPPASGRTGRPVAAAAALLAVVARVTSIVLWPPDSDASHAEMLATAGAHPTAWYAATWAEVICWVCAGAAVLAMTGLVRGKGVWAARIGGWTCGSSLLTLGLVGGSQNVVTGVLGSQHDTVAMVKVQDAISAAGPMLPFVALVMLGELLSILFAIGLARNGLVGSWYVALAVATVVGYILTSDYSDHLVNLLGFVPLAAWWLVLARLLNDGPHGTARA
jgi:hypothetical protein